MGFWNTPKVGPPMRQWKPGEKRSYIPVISFRADEPTPAAGVVGQITEMDSTRQERAVKPGGRGGGTKGP